MRASIPVRSWKSTLPRRIWLRKRGWVTIARFRRVASSGGNGASAGGTGTPRRGAASVRYASNERDTLTRSLRNGALWPQKRARIVFRIEQWSSTMSGPLPAGTQGETTNVGTRTP